MLTYLKLILTIINELHYLNNFIKFNKTYRNMNLNGCEQTNEMDQRRKCTIKESSCKKISEIGQ